jgi:phage terminase small subunit
MNVPSHLKAPGRRLWRAATADYLIDAAGLELLRLAAESLDRADEARQAIAKDGPYIAGRYAGNVRPHPALAVERDSRLAAARLIRELGLADPPEHPPIAATPRRGPKTAASR